MGADELFYDATFSPGVRSEHDVLKMVEDIRRMI